jgi:PadR family transcriptional regulator, regulatory protein PadR
LTYPDTTLAPASIDLMRGTLDLLVMRSLAWQPMHGYAVSKWLRDRTGGQLGVEESALYQALHRLERKGLIESEWGLTETNRRAKFYAVTATGAKQLARDVQAWEQYTRVVQLVLDPAEGGVVQ